MGAKTIPGGRPRWSAGPRQHGHHNPPNCHHRSFKVTCPEFDALHDEAASHCQLCGGFTTYLMLDHDHQLGQWAKPCGPEVSASHVGDGSEVKPGPIVHCPLWEPLPEFAEPSKAVETQ